MNIVIQIVIRYGKNPSASISRSIIMVRPCRCFSKVPSIRPDFPNWWWYYYRELHEGEKESCPRPNEAVKNLNSSRGSLTCPRNSIESRSIHKNYNNSTESKRERFLEKFSLLNGDWASDSPFNTTSSKTVSVNAVSTKKVGGFPRRTSTNQDDSLLS